MKTVTFYDCEICRARFLEARHAIQCEDRGREEALPLYLIAQNTQRGAFYKGLVFMSHELTREGHGIGYGFYITRPTAVGDSFKKECGGDRGNLTPSTSPDVESPEFQRMIEFARKEGIVPMIWNGKKPVSVSKFLGRKWK